MSANNPLIHPTAVIHPSAHLGPDVQVGPYVVIGENVTLGKKAIVGPHAVIEHAIIGEESHIHPGAFVGTPPQDLKYKGEKTHVKIGSKTVIRECVTINRGTDASGATVVGDGCLLMAYSHVAHDCVIGNQVIMANVSTLAGHVHVGDGAVIGGLSAIHQFTRVGPMAMLGGGSMVASDVAPFCMVQGDRAQIVGLNIVGLRRRGLSRDHLSALKTAFKTVFYSSLTLEQALKQIDSLPAVPEVKIFADFFRRSTRGFCRPDRSKSTAAVLEDAD